MRAAVNFYCRQEKRTFILLPSCMGSDGSKAKGEESRSTVYSDARERLGARRFGAKDEGGKGDTSIVVTSALYGKKHDHPHNQYMTAFVRHGSSPLLLQMKVFPDSKELSESMACAEAIRRFVRPDPKDATFLVVGDGSTPRTAALLALLYPESKSYSIDPQLKMPSLKAEMSPDDAAHPSPEIKNLFYTRGLIEDVYIRAPRVCVVMMHAHVSIDQVLTAIHSSTTDVSIVACPCCCYHEGQSKFQGRCPDHQGDDYGIWSEQRHMRVWTTDDGNRDKFFKDGDAAEQHSFFSKDDAVTGATKALVKRVLKEGLTWHLQPSIEEAMSVAERFYQQFPNKYGEHRARSIHGGINDFNEFQVRCKSLQPGEVDSSEEPKLYEFTGRVTKGVKSLGKKLCFFDMTLRDGSVLNVMVNQSVLSGEVEGVDVNSGMLSSAVRAFPGSVRVTGFARLSKTNGVVLDAHGIRIHIPKPIQSIVEARLNKRRVDPGLFRKDCGWYTGTGNMDMDNLPCYRCGRHLPDIDSLDEHVRAFHGVIRV